MPAELQLPVFKVEVLTPGLLFQADFQPKGDFLIFMNDRRYSYIRFEAVQLRPITEDAQFNGVAQPFVAVSKRHIIGLSVLEAEKMNRVQVLQAKRPFVIYSDWYIIQGNLHINPDARDDDAFDETRDFFGLTDAAIYPIRSLRKRPTARIPFVTINRHNILAYHPLQK